MAIEVNGMSLPDIPEGAFDTYPHGIIVKFDGSDGSWACILYCTSSEVIAVPASFTGENNDIILCMDSGADVYAIESKNLTWEHSGQSAELQVEVYLGSVTAGATPLNTNDGTYTLVWANHDIKTVTGIDGNYNFIYGEIYFTDSTAVFEEAYAVSSEWLFAISQQVRRLTQSGNRRTVDKMLADLMAYIAPTDYMVQRLNGIIYEYSSDEVTKICDYAFHSALHLESVNLPNATEVGRYALAYTYSLKEVNLPAVTVIKEHAFQMSCVETLEFPTVTTVNKRGLNSAYRLTKVDFYCAEQFMSSAFGYSNALTTLIIRTTTGICKLMYEDSDTEEVVEGYMLHFDGIDPKPFVYVPSTLIADYQANAAWTASGVTFRALEDYTVDGTTTGALDETKI